VGRRRAERPCCRGSPAERAAVRLAAACPSWTVSDAQSLPGSGRAPPSLPAPAGETAWANQPGLGGLTGPIWDSSFTVDPAREEAERRKRYLVYRQLYCNTLPGYALAGGFSRKVVGAPGRAPCAFRGCGYLAGTRRDAGSLTCPDTEHDSGARGTADDRRRSTGRF
jgi:hypothetical protein